MILMPFFNIILPASTQTVFDILLQIYAFDMMPCGPVFAHIEDSVAKIEINPRAERFGSIGFEGVWIIPNLGSFFILMAIFPLRCLALPCMSLLGRRWPRFLKRQRALKRSLISIWPIMTLSDNYTLMAMGSMLNISFVKWNNTSGTPLAILNLVVAYLLCSLILLYPAIQSGCLYINRHRLEEKKCLKYYGVAYEGLKETDGNYI